MRSILKFSGVMVFGLVAATATYAGKEVGNGGDVIVCRNPDKSIRSVELLDFYEGRILRGLEKNIPNSTTVQALETALSRLERREPIRAKRYRQWAETFFQETNLLPNVDLVDIPDSQHLAFPKGCAVEQIAIQTPPRYPQDKRYLISRDLWDAMDSVNQAGLILHELIYREALTSDEPRIATSIPVRYLNSLIFSDQLVGFPVLQYSLLAKDLGFKTHHLQGLEIYTESAKFYPSGALQEAHISEQFRDGVISIPRFFYAKGIHSVIRYYENGMPKYVRFDQGEMPLQRKTLRWTKPSFVEFHENGTLSQTQIHENFPYVYLDKELLIYNGQLSQYSDGSPKLLTLAQAAEFPIPSHGGAVVCDFKSHVSFSEKGIRACAIRSLDSTTTRFSQAPAQGTYYFFTEDGRAFSKWETVAPGIQALRFGDRWVSVRSAQFSYYVYFFDTDETFTVEVQPGNFLPVSGKLKFDSNNGKLLSGLIRSSEFTLTSGPRTLKLRSENSCTRQKNRFTVEKYTESRITNFYKDRSPFTVTLAEDSRFQLPLSDKQVVIPAGTTVSLTTDGTLLNRWALPPCSDKMIELQ